MQTDRRTVLKLVASVATLAGAPVTAEPAFRLGLTPVFLDNDAQVIDRLRAALAEAMGGAIELIQRRTYEDITGLLLEGSVDAAWTCGYPYMQHVKVLSLLGVPVWQGLPLYRSYLIVGADDTAGSLADLRGGSHAFSDPNSNSGFLVTASDLARMHETPEGFFGRIVFTFGHRNVVRAVAGGLTRSGSVDGYVWEAMSQVEPALTAQTRIVSRSELLGFPPFVARNDRAETPAVIRFAVALTSLHQTAPGREALALLFLDRIIPGDVSLFDGIAERMREIGRPPP